MLRLRPKISIIGASFAAFLLIGIAITKLTVHDLVPVDAALARCVEDGVTQQFDNPLERVALLLGKTRVTRTDIDFAESESFTLFRLPMGVLRGQPDLRMSVFCDYFGNPKE